MMIIAQISDTHIVPKGQEWKSLPETKVAARLTLVVNSLNSLTPKPDIVLLTGDTIDEGGKAAYDHLKEILKPLSMPLYIIPGNHDEREDMRLAFEKESYMPRHGFIQYVVDNYAVRLIALDTVVPGETYGLLCKERVGYLKRALQENTEKPTLIFMHHPVIEVGQKVIDHVKCFTPEGFEDLIGSFPNIIGIIAGHNHTPCMTRFGEASYFIAPSVAPSFHCFEEGDDNHTTTIDLAHPSFVLHKWRKGFHLLSEVIQAVGPEERLLRKKVEAKKLSSPSFLNRAIG